MDMERQIAEQQLLRAASKSVSSIITDVCTANAAYGVVHEHSHPLSCFDCMTPPPISIADYMCQVERAGSTRLWPQCLILVDQLSRVSRVPVTMVNAHRLLVTAYVIALKLAVDSAGLIPRVAFTGGISTEDLVLMERTFLKHLDWHVCVGPTAHAMFCENHDYIRSAMTQAADTPGSRGGPVTLIPDAVVPTDVRFCLMVELEECSDSESLGSSCGPVSITGLDAPGISSEQSTADSDGDSSEFDISVTPTTESFPLFVPCPPRRPCGDDGRTARPQLSYTTPQTVGVNISKTAQVEGSGICHAGRRIESAMAYARIVATAR
eukprot:TRINITY_DN72573_c0_g1_i1.p1 TRINITY_DN72573_c0_g1~~TRINITY_DN72573_c0_g1_i1.p1  ORF type:complete len:323 (+),score=59.92 TRINITY_DN72573_c0_g1_i1:80-1048(+)